MQWAWHSPNTLPIIVHGKTFHILTRQPSNERTFSLRHPATSWPALQVWVLETFTRIQYVCVEIKVLLNGLPHAGGHGQFVCVSTNKALPHAHMWYLCMSLVLVVIIWYQDELSCFYIGNVFVLGFVLCFSLMKLFSHTHEYCWLIEEKNTTYTTRSAYISTLTVRGD